MELPNDYLGDGHSGVEQIGTGVLRSDCRRPALRTLHGQGLLHLRLQALRGRLAGPVLFASVPGRQTLHGLQALCGQPLLQEERGQRPEARLPDQPKAGVLPFEQSSVPPFQVQAEDQLGVREQEAPGPALGPPQQCQLELLRSQFPQKKPDSLFDDSGRVDFTAPWISGGAPVLLVSEEVAGLSSKGQSHPVHFAQNYVSGRVARGLHHQPNHRLLHAPDFPLRVPQKKDAANDPRIEENALSNVFQRKHLHVFDFLRYQAPEKRFIPLRCLLLQPLPDIRSHLREVPNRYRVPAGADDHLVSGVLDPLSSADHLRSLLSQENLQNQ